MADIRTLILGITLVSLIAPSASFAYDRQTHEGITDAIIKTYEKVHGDTFSDADSSAIVSGSSAEDDDSRFLNHFYDPTSYRGLTEFGIALGEPSEGWVQDTKGQAAWKCLPYMPCGHDVGYNDKLFSSPTDYSWDRAVYDYVYGDKKRALAALGHVLHIIEDATVPAHVRNDQHGHIGVIGDPDPYETYASQFRVGNVPMPIDLSRIPTYSNLIRYIDDAAFYTNAHFVSKDTLFRGYQSPRLKSLILKEGFAYDSGGVKIAQVITTTDSVSGKVNITETHIDDGAFSVAADDWKVLSNKAILNGAGVIDLFFKRVKEEEQTHALQKKNVSAADLRVKELALKGFNTAKMLYGSSLTQGDVADLLNDTDSSQAGAAALAALPAKEVPANGDAHKEVAADQPPPPEPEPKEVNVESVAAPAPTAPATTTRKETPPPIIAPTVISPGFGGGGGGSVARAEEQAEETPVSIDFSIVSPADSVVYGTSSVAFAGTTIPSGFVSASFGGSVASTSADGSGNWMLLLMLPEGTTRIAFTASDNAAAHSTSTVRDISVDLTPTDAAVVSIPACGHSLSGSFCLVATTSLVISWGSVAGATSYAIVRNGSIGATTTATSYAVGIASGASTTIAVVSYDAAGNAATSSASVVYAAEQPVIINEVGFGGVGDYEFGIGIDHSIQWIELKNRTAFDIDLSRLAIVRSTGSTIPLSGALPAGALPYLVVSNTHFDSFGSPQITVPFDALSGSGEQISLAWDDGSASTTIDATPAPGACAQWCAGSDSATIGTTYTGAALTSTLSMERIDGTVDGTAAASWRSTDTYGTFMWGTPNASNTSGLPYAGVYCGTPGNLVVANAPYNPGTDECVALTSFIEYAANRATANRYAGLYRGEVGSSTAMTGAGAGLFRTSATFPLGSFRGVAPVGEPYFFAIWEHPAGPAFDGFNAMYDAYFTSSLSTGVGLGSGVTFNYVTIPFMYRP